MAQTRRRRGRYNINSLGENWGELSGQFGMFRFHRCKKTALNYKLVEIQNSVRHAVSGIFIYDYFVYTLATLFVTPSISCERSF